MPRSFLLCLMVLPVLADGSPLSAQTVWTGPHITFAKAPLADPTQAANQDRMTNNVWVTRASVQGLFNAATETSYTRNSSPAGTAWAFPHNNPLVPLAELTATNWSALTFEPWETAFGGPNAMGPQGRGPLSTLDQPAVLHLTSDNIYLNIRFIAWGGAENGSFTYERSTPIPEPACLGLIAGALSLAGILGSRQMR